MSKEEFVFANEKEAVQYLANLTGKSIKIAADDDKYKLDVTYEIWNQEDMEIGDTDKKGYEEENLKFDSLYEMIDYMIDNGAVEPSGSDYFHANTWYSSVDPVHDRDFFEKGENKTYSFHPKGITEEEGKIIFDSIKSGKNQAQDIEE